MRKKILHLTNSSVKSNFLLSIAKLYNKEKYELFIGTLEEKGELHTELEKLNISCTSFNLKDERLGFFKILPIIRYLKRNKIDILHVHTFWASLYACIAAKLIHTKVVMTRHHADHHIRANKINHVKIDAFTAKMVDKVIAVSNFTKSLMINVEKVPENHIEVIYNGLEELPSRQFDQKSFLEHLNIHSSDKILQYFTIIQQLEHENVFIANPEPINNTRIRISYMLNYFSDSFFKDYLQRQEKMKDKWEEVANIYDVLVHSGGDLLRQYVLEPSRESEIENILDELFKYGNTIFQSVRKRYVSVLPRNIYV